jgi:hypothetical protein
MEVVLCEHDSDRGIAESQGAAMTLPGPSRTIIVEPIELPARPQPERAPELEPVPEREPREPRPAPEREPMAPVPERVPG